MPLYIHNFQLEAIRERKARRDEARRLSESSKPDQILILDTNALFTKRGDEIFSSKTTQAIYECRKFTAIRVIVPRVCLLERLYQVNFTAIARFAKAQSELESLGALTRSYLKGYECPTDIRPLVYRRALEWCGSHSINVNRTPISKLNWNAVVRDSIWRKPPFEPYNSEKKTEKGFRDSMVLATVNAIVAERGDVPVAFICGDNLLRETAEQIHKENKAFSAYPSMGEFRSAVEIAKADVSRWLADILVREAPRIFNAEIYTKLELPTVIVKQHPGNLYYSFQQLEGESGYLKQFIPLTEERFRIGPTFFSMIDEHRRYHWVTEVSIGCGFKEGEDGFPKIRAALFDIKWNCRFEEDGTYKEVALGKISFNGLIVQELAELEEDSPEIARKVADLLAELDTEFADARAKQLED